MAALEAAHERLARAKAEHARERMVRVSNPAKPAKEPGALRVAVWLWVAVAILAYLVAWRLLS